MHVFPGHGEDAAREEAKPAKRRNVAFIVVDFGCVLSICDIYGVGRSEKLAR